MDGVSSGLQMLSTPQIHNLLNSFEAHRSSHEGAAASHLHAAVSAAAANDAPRALSHLSEYLKISPGNAGALLASPAFLPMQGSVQDMLRHVTHDARVGAEGMIAAGRLAVSGAMANPAAIYGTEMLDVAERFAESGQLLNYIRASELSQSVIAAYSPVHVSRRKAAFGRKMAGLLAAFWGRVPLLVLLAGWFAAGMLAGIAALLARTAGVRFLSASTLQTGSEVWAIGFLGLVGVQFCISVQGARNPFNRE